MIVNGEYGFFYYSFDDWLRICDDSMQFLIWFSHELKVFTIYFFDEELGSHL